MKIIDKDLGWGRIKKELALAKRSHVNVGVLSTAGTYASDDGPVNIADVATFNEFGTSAIPSRPFMAQAFDSNLESIKSFVSARFDELFSGKITTETGLKMIGVFFKGKVQETISKGDFAPNAPSTVAAKGSSHPLIDTGRLRQSINFEVKIK